MARSFAFAVFKPSTSTSWFAPLLSALAGGAYCIVVLLCFREYVNGGTPLLLAESFAFALGPVAAYVALRSPLILPFCLYVLFLPFETLAYVSDAAGSFARLLGIASAGAIFVYVLRRGNAVAPPRATIAWLVLLGLMSASIFWSIEPSGATSYLQMYASLIALFALLSIVRVKRFEFNAILAAVVVAGVASGGYDAYLYRNTQDVVNAGAGASRVIVMLGDSSIDPNELASALILPFAIGLYWLFNSRHRWLRALMLPSISVLLLGFAASGSRGGFFQLGAVFAYLIVRSRHRLWLAAIMVGSALCALAANPGLPARFMAAQQDGGAGRSDIWHIGLYAFRDHWLIGAGVGNFADAFDREYIHVFAHYVLGWHWVAHNVPLTIATELGIVGLVIYATAVTMQLLVLRGHWTSTPLFELRLALEAACIGMLVAGLSTSTLNAKFVWLVFSLMTLMRSYGLTTVTSRRRSVADRRSLRFPWASGTRAAVPQNS